MSGLGIDGELIADRVDLTVRGLEAASDVGRARLLRDLLRVEGGDLLHARARGFYLWRDGVWRPEADAEVRGFAQRLGDRLREAAHEVSGVAAQEADEDRRKALQAKASRLLALARSPRTPDASTPRCASWRPSTGCAGPIPMPSTPTRTCSRSPTAT